MYYCTIGMHPYMLYYNYYDFREKAEREKREGERERMRD
jgi:hypothetical protein